MSFPVVSHLSPDGKLAEGYTPNIPIDILLKGYEAMCLARHVDERMITLQRQGKISFAMSSLGEEACSVASAAALSIDDWMYPQYRECGAIFFRGFTPLEYIHQMFGSRDDLNRGRQMPNHFGSKKLNVVTVSSPIATKIPHAAGAAYAMKLQKENNVVICYFGEGATSEGDFHCGLNFAAVRACPVIFFCRNNSYAISTPACRQFHSSGVAEKGIGYGIEVRRVDGNDFFAVYDAVKQAKEHCLSKKAPMLIEAMTYRLGAHSTSDDPSLYRSEKEVEEWKKKCPVLRLRKYLESQNLWDEKKETEMKKTIEKQVQEAIETAKSTPKPLLESIVEDVYFEVPENLKLELQNLKEIFNAE